MIQNSQKLKMTQVLITLCVSRQWSTVPIKKKRNTYTYCSVDRPLEHQARNQTQKTDCCTVLQRVISGWLG